MPQSVLIVDDDADTLMLAREALDAGGIGSVSTLRDGHLVKPYLAANRCNLVLLDLGLPSCDGRELICDIVSTHPDVSVVVVSGKDEVSTAVSCIHRGAYDYLVKPISPDRLVDAARRALGTKRMRLPPRAAKPGSPEAAFADIVTQSAALRGIFQYVQSIACTGQPVLITGETGTGKDMIARSIHRLSGQRGEYVAVNVGGFDDTMFADALFGHRKGAFTGATEPRPGLVLRATAGTLFLDEIGDLSLVSQVKLLRLLQDGEYFPLGSDHPKHSTARVLVATSQDLRRMQDAGKFRKDLFYRLRAHHVHLPPLRERPEDIPVLLDHFLTEAATEFNRAKADLSSELRRIAGEYRFPGNVRELRSLVYDAVSRSPGKQLILDPFRQAVSEASSAPDTMAAGGDALRFPSKLPTLREVRDELIAEALKRANGNQALAASYLGITRQGLNKRLRSELDQHPEP